MEGLYQALEEMDTSGEKWLPHLQHVIQSGQAAELVKILKQHSSSIPLKVVNEAFLLAVKLGHKRMVHLLLDCGFSCSSTIDIDIDFKDSDGNTAFMIAVQHGFTDIAFFLLQFSPGMEVTNSEGDTAMFLSLSHGNHRLLKELINDSHLRPNLSLKNRHGKTALMVAVELQDFDAMELLLGLGDDICARHIRDNNEKTAEDLARTSGIEDMYFMLNATKDVPALLSAIKSGKTALVAALLHGCIASEHLKSDQEYCQKCIVACFWAGETSLNLLKLLLHSGLTDGCQPFQIVNDFKVMSRAVEWGNLEGIEMLLKRGWSAIGSERVDDNPLMLAVRSDRPDIIEVLLTHCWVDIKICVIGGDGALTALDLAVIKSHTECVRKLLKAGAVPDSKTSSVSLSHGNKDIYKLTSLKEALPSLTLHCRFAASNIELAKYLIESGECVNSKSPGFSDAPLISAIQHKSPELVNLLLKNGAQVNLVTVDKNWPVKEAILQANTTILLSLIEFGADVNFMAEDGSNALSWAAKMGEPCLIKILLENGADANIANPHTGKLPIYFAIKWGIHVVEPFVPGTHDLNHHDKKGKTPLMVAAKAGLPQTADYLIEHGSYMNLQDNGNYTALMHAISRNQTHAADAILTYEPDCTLKNEEGFNVLHYMCLEGNAHLLTVLEKLLENEVDINEGHEEHGTPLHMALKNSELEQNERYHLVSKLIEAGCDVNATMGGKFPSPLICAAKSYSTNSDITELLLKSGARTSGVCQCAVEDSVVDHVLDEHRTWTNYSKNIGILIKAGALPKREVSNTNFHLMIINNQVEALFLLARHGKAPCYVRCKDILALLATGTLFSQMWSPLQTAIFSGNVFLVEQFIQARYLTQRDFYYNQEFQDVILPRRNKTRDQVQCIKLYYKFLVAPHSLSLLSFVSVSEALGSGPQREQAVRQSGLPWCFQRELMFTDLEHSLTLMENRVPARTDVPLPNIGIDCMD